MRKVAGGGNGAPLLPLITRDPVSGGELVVTRLESPQSGLVIEGAFSLGWIGRLTPEQLEFVGHLVRNRGNVQKVAADLNIAYNTARNRLDDIVAALDAPDDGMREATRNGSGVPPCCGVSPRAKSSSTRRCASWSGEPRQEPERWKGAAMNEQVTNYVNGIFAPYEGVKSVAELKADLLSDLQERFRELKAEGKDDETALSMTIESIGDIEQTVQEVTNLSRSHY